ncbi:hypothetical protein GYMLUDRAFT_35711 [Collybiopsis luxurians FD-317 M1]|nr:hypothetical protein GYMLUDRAFT_35711 [Collybiopsis luxurians FD-317 M1]
MSTARVSGNENVNGSTVASKPTHETQLDGKSTKIASTQPSPKPPMTPQPSSDSEGKESLMRRAADKFVDELEDQAKDQAKEQAKEFYQNNQQQFQQDIQNTEDQAKAYAQGMWAKYCGCLS